MHEFLHGTLAPLNHLASKLNKLIAPNCTEPLSFDFPVDCKKSRVYRIIFGKNLIEFEYLHSSWFPSHAFVL